MLAEALPASEVGQLRWFHAADETFIRREVERKLFRPELPNAGAAEREWVGLLQELSQPDFWRLRTSALGFDGAEKSVGWLCARARRLAEALDQLLPRAEYDRQGRPNPGQYYFWHPLTFKHDKQGAKWFAELRQAAFEAEEWDVKWFADLMTGGENRPGGRPEGISDFRVEVLCGLRRWNHKVVRLVRLKNFLGEESAILALDAEGFKSPEHFRCWCLEQGNFSWGGNQKQLQQLHWDTNRMNAWRIMTEIDCLGWTPLPRRHDHGTEAQTSESPPTGVLHGLWFYGDCAYCDGQLLERDRDNLYTVDGEGYFLAERGRESEFALRQPMLRPGVQLGDLLTRADLAEFSEPPAPKSVAERKQTTPGPQDPKTQKTRVETVRDLFSETELLRAYFQEVSRRLVDTAGGYEAYLAMGAIFAYAAAPEIFAAYGLFPGLWVHGQMESGKTKFTEWLLHLAGFNVTAGISAMKSTTVGILQESQNYSNLPLWIDEYRNREVSDDKVGGFRDAYNRPPPVKWNPEGIQRKIKTAYVISGESTSSDAATRSRYPHVQISAARRKQNHLIWFTRHQKNFFVFWRLLMERRAEFVLGVFKYLKLFLTGQHLLSEREKMVHGIDWAALRAMADLVGVETPGEFDDFVLEHMTHASGDVTAETNINVFWTDLINAFNEDAIELGLFRLESEHYHRDAGDKLTGRRLEYPAGEPWVSYTLFFEPNGVVSALAAHLRQRGQTVSLRRNDLRDQLSKNPYWVPGRHRKRFGAGLAGGIPAWGIRLDRHPLGRQEVTPEEFQAALDPHPRNLSAAVQPHSFLDGDPRKGPLFAIIHALEQREEKARLEE